VPPQGHWIPDRIFARCRLQFVMWMSITLFNNIHFFFPLSDSFQWARSSSLSRFHYHTHTHHTRYDSSGRVFNPTRRPLSENTQTFTRDKHPYTQRDSNPHSRQASDRRPTPSTARPPGSATMFIEVAKLRCRQRIVAITSNGRKISEL
jgi:hypothetical protein